MWFASDREFRLLNTSWVDVASARPMPDMTSRQRFELVAVLLLALGTPSCRGTGCPEAQYPPSLGSGPASQLRQKYRATEAFELEAQPATLRVLVFRECVSDYKVIFYRRGQSGFLRFGPEFNLLNFEQPLLDGSPKPTIRTRHIPSGERHYFRVTADDVNLVPEQGEWQTLPPGVALPGRGSGHR
jgi:hypothetical protein